MSLKKSKIVVVLILTVITSIVIYKNVEEPDENILYTNVKYGKFVKTVTVSGELEAASSVVIKTPDEMRGRYIRINGVKIQDIVPEGTIVKKGDYVATLDKSEVFSVLKEIEDRIEDMQNQIANHALDTTQQLKNERNSLAKMEFEIEEAILTLEQSKYEPPVTIRQNEIKLEQLKRDKNQFLENLEIKKKQLSNSMYEKELGLKRQIQQKSGLLGLLDKFTILAPAPGIVVYYRDNMGKKRTAGEEVSPYDPIIATLPDLSKMTSKAYVNEIEISEIKEGQTVEVKVDAFPSKIFNGKVTHVSKMGQTLPFVNTKVYEVDIILDNPDLVLHPSMTTKNTIEIFSHENTLYLPLEAIHMDTATYVYIDNKTKQIVKLGFENADEVIIEDGLKAGEKVLLTVPQTHDKYSTLPL